MIGAARHYVLVLVTAGELVGGARCAPAQVHPSLAGDTALFAAVVRAGIHHAEGVPVRVDPVPLRADSTIESADSAGRAFISADDLRARLRVLTALGVDTVDATMTGQQSCPSAFRRTGGSHTTVDSAHTRCPRTPFQVLAIALPREGSASPAAGVYYDRDAQVAAKGYWSVRVIRTTMTPYGASVQVLDYVLRRTHASWTVVATVSLVSID